MGRPCSVYGLVLSLTLAILGGCTGETDNESGDVGPVDRFVDVGGHRLHFQSMGEGTPVVVFDTGITETYRTWEGVFAGVSRDSRVVVYDRAGYGDSEVGSFPRTAQQVVSELHRLLEQAEVGDRFLLVGHSLGATHMVAFAAAHPGKVSGLVVIDPPPLEFITGRQFTDLLPMFRQQTSEFNRLAQEHRQAGREDQAGFFQTVASESEMLIATTAEQIAKITDLGDIPLIVIGSSRPNPAFGEAAQAFQAFWIESNQKLATLSTQGKFILAENAGHHVHLDAPEIIRAAIDEIVASSANSK